MTKRNLIQTLFLIVGLVILGAVIIVGKMSIHDFCPYAFICFGLQKGDLWQFSLGIAALGVFLGMVFMIVSMFWGRIFCGYVCPLGTLQELIFCLRGKRKTKQAPFFAERKLSRLKYAMLLITSGLVISGLAWIYINFCPIYALSRLPGWAPLVVVVAAMIGISGFFIERMWCRYLCPYAALMNLAQAMGNVLGIPRTKIRRNLERCVDCGICSLNCPMNLDILGDEYVNSPDCIHCLRCARKCPKPGTIGKGKEL